MKYFNFKRYKFSTVLKNIYTIRDKSLKFFKFTDFRKIYNYIDIRRYIDITRYIDIRRYINIRRLDFTKIIQYLKSKRYYIYRIKRINFATNKFLFFHLPLSVIFFAFLYLFIPTFYSYDKSSIEAQICKNKDIECLIRGEVNYIFYPTPRIKVKHLIINDFFEKKNTLITAEDVAIKLSIKNLLVKNKHLFKKIEINNFEINFNLKNLKKYNNIFKQKINFIPIVFKKGQIILLDRKNYIATINNANFNLEFQDFNEIILKGKFLDDTVYINLNNKKIDNKKSTNIIFKMSDLNFLSKISFSNSEKDKNIINGNILIKRNKNKFNAIFDYKDNEIIINKSNLKNSFADGKLEGQIKFLPYFDYNLDLSLKSINFTRLYNHFLVLESKNKKKLFKINNKLNGNLNFSADKLYSKYNLVKSFESRIKFYNGNISIEQFLLNLGKLGAADILGTISNDKKFTSLNFESNVFVDNQKKFLSKFGIYNAQTIPSNLFISGIFDLENIRTSFYEISDAKKFSDEDVNYIEKEFNNIMLEDGYTNLFDFPKFKEFIKLITSDTN